MKHFKESEFECPCGCGLNFKDMDKDLIKKLIIARRHAGTPFFITSSIRCKNHNKKVGGSPMSSHLAGLAVDITCDCSKKRFRIVKGLILAGFTRIEIAKRHIHADADEKKAKRVLWVQYGDVGGKSVGKK